MNRLTWCQPCESMEEILCQAGQVGIYDGDLKQSEFEQGTASLTLHRIIWADSTDPSRIPILSHQMKHGTLKVGFVNEAFPFVFRNRFTGVWKGLYVDMWRMFASSTGYDLQLIQGDEYGNWSSNNNGQWSGLLRMIQKGEINATMEGYSLTRKRYESFKASFACDYFKETFYSKDTTFDTASINSFIVFSPQFIVLLVASVVVVVAVERIRYLCEERWKAQASLSENWTLRERERSASPTNSYSTEWVYLTEKEFTRHHRFQWNLVGDERKCATVRRILDRIWFLVHYFFFAPPSLFSRLFNWRLRSLSIGFYLFALVLMAVIYSATFKGNIVSKRVEKSSDLHDLISDLTAKRKKLILLSESLLKSEQIVALFGSDVSEDRSRLIVEEDLYVLLQRVCKDTSLVAFLANTAMSTVPRVPCELLPFDTSDIRSFPVNSAIDNSNFGILYPGVFYLSKTFDQKLLDQLNFILFKFYSDQMVFEWWWRRYTSRPKILPPGEKSRFVFNAIQLQSIQIVWEVLIGGYVISVIAFFTEMIVHRVSTHRKLQLDVSLCESLIPIRMCSFRTIDNDKRMGNGQQNSKLFVVSTS